MITVNNTDFENVTPINNKWIVLDNRQCVEIFFNGEKLRITTEPCFLFDGASVPKYIPFNNHIRWLEALKLPALVHDIMFIHKFRDYNYAADVMEMLMDELKTPMRRPINRAIRGLIAKRIFDSVNVTDYINKPLSTIEVL